MQDNQIFKIALLTSILGLSGMIFLSGMVVPQEFKINQISKNHIGEDASITGLIRSVEAYDKKTIHFICNRRNWRDKSSNI